MQKKSNLSIKDQQLSYEPDWSKKFYNLLLQSYQKRPCFPGIKQDIRELLDQKFETVAELNIQTVLWALSRLLNTSYTIPIDIEQINYTLASDSRFPLEIISLGSSQGLLHDTSATERILQLCRQKRCTGYIAGGTAIESYFDIARFRQAGIAVKQQDWGCAPYNQSASPSEFSGNLSILDLLSNCSSEESLEKLISNFSLVDT